ncbi:MAG: T9SS type A sorting domain-containing protein [Bacteroidetes bacterium]|nr:T9SS type A sorting domain-containing protein [Bacteroidota bacterium]
MKKILLTIFILTGHFANALSGGPDGFGYTWKDSNEPGGPTYQWWDITSTGTQVSGLGDDNFVGPVQIGFQFSYYWYTESKIWIGSNGYLGFGPGNIAANFPPIPQVGGVNNYIAALMADYTFLGLNNPGECYYKATQDSFCVEWLNVPFWDQNPPSYNGMNTFEIVLSRLDSSITVNFQSHSGTSISNFSSGIENNIGTMGLQPLTYLPVAPNYTIKYYYPTGNVLQVTDASVSWNHQDGDGAIFLANNGGNHLLVTQIENSGNVSIGPVTVNGKVKDLINTQYVTSNAFTVPLVPGQNQTLSFTNQFAPTSPGTRYFMTKISGVPGDAIPINDSIYQEIVVVDTTQSAIRLSYTGNQTDPIGSSISWAGGQGGVGVYFKPPTYPARILNTNFILLMAPISGPAFYAKIYADNGPQGSPGTLLDSVLVDGAQISTSAITVVPVSGNVVIQSGGFYVNWEMANTTSVAIAEDLSPPFSRQTFETFQNIWSTFRDYQNADFFIGADYVCSSPEDVGVSSIFSPVSNSTVSNPTNVTCWITNYATTSDNYYINVNYKLGGNPTIVTQPYTGPLIPAGDSVLFTFTTQLTPPYSGADILYAWTSKTSDVDHTNDTSFIHLNLVGIEELNHFDGISVYPIPTSDKVNFHFAKGTNDAIIISITDLTGKIIEVRKFNGAISGSSISIDFSGYAVGSYLYSITSGDKSGNGKIIKTK